MNLSRQQIAWRVAQDLPDGAAVFLGTGMPLLVSDYVPSERQIIFQTESSLPEAASQQGFLLDYTVLGACQVSGNGDLVLPDPPDGKALAASAATDLAPRARNVLVMMEFFAKDGRTQLVPECTLPLTAQRCVHRIYTDLAVLDIDDGKVVLRELVEGITLHVLQAETEVELVVSSQLRLLQAPRLP